MTDFVDAYRSLRSSRSYAAWVVGSLAIGMAVTIAALALLNAMLVLPFPQVTDQHRLVRLEVSRNCGPFDVAPGRPVGSAQGRPFDFAQGRRDCWVPMSGPEHYAALREGLTSLQDLAGYTVGEIAVGLPDARSMRGMFASGNYFDVLGVRPAAGRVFVPGDADTHAAIAVIAHSVWTREFQADPLVIGRSIRVGDQFVQIVGVAPELFGGIDRIRPGTRDPDLWLPMWLADSVLPTAPADDRRPGRAVAFVGRMRDGSGVPQIQAEADVVARRLAVDSGGRAEVRRVWRVRPESWHIGVLVVMPIPILILVLACVNAANLMLARGSQRKREIAIRLAIGAGRGRIIRQLLVESAALALLATAVAVPLAYAGLQLASSPLNVPIPFDRLVLALTVLTAVATTVAFGLAPAVRVSAHQPSSALGPVGARGDASPHQSRMRRLLVLAQVALSVGLLATAWQFVSTVRLQAVSGGTPGDRLLVARFDLQPLGFAAGEVERFYRELVQAAARLPGADAVGLARHTSVWTFGQRAPSGFVVWRATDAPAEGQTTGGGYAGADLFDAVGLRTIAGRGFTEADRQLRPQVAVVNETAARRMNGRAIGSVLRVAPRGQDFRSSIEVRVVGVIEPAHEPRLEADDPPAAKVYLPSPIEPEPALSLYLRTHGTATALAQPVREIVSRIAPRVPVQEVASLDELNERSYEQQLWLARAAAFLGVIGLLLATAGLYGVSSYVVAMRSREIAIRMAVGARPETILAMVLNQSMRTAVIGLLIGGAAAIAVSRLIQSEYHGIVGIDAAAFGGSAALFLAAMLLASAIPAVRASRVDPVEKLKDA